MTLIVLLTGCGEEKGETPDIYDICSRRESEETYETDDMESEDAYATVGKETTAEESISDEGMDTTVDTNADYLSEDITEAASSDNPEPDLNDNHDIATGTGEFGYETGEYITIVEDDGSESEYYYAGDVGSDGYADYTEDNSVDYAEYQNNLDERQNKIVEGKNTSDEITVSSGSISK